MKASFHHILGPFADESNDIKLPNVDLAQRCLTFDVLIKVCLIVSEQTGQSTARLPVFWKHLHYFKTSENEVSELCESITFFHLEKSLPFCCPWKFENISTSFKYIFIVQLFVTFFCLTFIFLSFKRNIIRLNWFIYWVFGTASLC